MPRTWEEVASLVTVITACAVFIVWIANIWIINPLTKSLDELSDKINQISRQHDGKLEKHEHRLNHHTNQIQVLKNDVASLKRKE